MWFWNVKFQLQTPITSVRDLQLTPDSVAWCFLSPKGYLMKCITWSKVSKTFFIDLNERRERFLLVFKEIHQIFSFWSQKWISPNVNFDFVAREKLFWGTWCTDISLRGLAWIPGYPQNQTGSSYDTPIHFYDPKRKERVFFHFNNDFDGFRRKIVVKSVIFDDFET